MSFEIGTVVALIAYAVSTAVFIIRTSTALSVTQKQLREDTSKLQERLDSLSTAGSELTRNLQFRLAKVEGYGIETHSSRLTQLEAHYEELARQINEIAQVQARMDEKLSLIWESIKSEKE